MSSIKRISTINLGSAPPAKLGCTNPVDEAYPERISIAIVMPLQLSRGHTEAELPFCLEEFSSLIRHN